MLFVRTPLAIVLAKNSTRDYCVGDGKRARGSYREVGTERDPVSPFNGCGLLAGPADSCEGILSRTLVKAADRIGSIRRGAPGAFALQPAPLNCEVAVVRDGAWILCSPSSLFLSVLLRLLVRLGRSC